MRIAYKIFRRIEGKLRPLAYPCLPKKYAVIYHPGKWISAPGKSRFFLFDAFDSAKIAIDDWHFVEPIEIWQVAYIGKLLRTDLVPFIGGRDASSRAICGRRFENFWRIFPPRNSGRLFQALSNQLVYAPSGTMTAKRIKLLRKIEPTSPKKRKEAKNENPKTGRI